MTGDRHLNGSDRILLNGVESSITELTADELSSLRRVLNLNIRITPVDFERCPEYQGLDAVQVVARRI